MTRAEPTFQWQGPVPIPDSPAHLEVRINLVTGIEFPGMGASDLLPHVGPVETLVVAGEPAHFYRYTLEPRGLRSLYGDRWQLRNFGLYLKSGPHHYHFRLSGDQGLKGEDSNLLRGWLEEIDAAYLRSDAEALRHTPFLAAVQAFMADSGTLAKEELRWVSEVVAEVGGELHYLLGRDDPGEVPGRLALPAAPGSAVAIAVRIGSLVRRVGARSLDEVRGKAVKGRRVELEVGPEPGSPPERIAARTDAEGWVAFPASRLSGPRRWRIRLGDEVVDLAPRWGRPIEGSLAKGGARFLPASASAPIETAPRTLLRDLESGYDPDTGDFAEITPGLRLPIDAEVFETLEALEARSEAARDVMTEFRGRVARRKGAELAGDPLSPFATGAISEKKFLTLAAVRQEAFDGEAPGLWTEDHARWVQGLASAYRRRPSKRLRGFVEAGARGFALRVEVESEPTWRFQAFRRPVKTFRANPDVAHPHGEAILALVRVARALDLSEGILDVAETQGKHLAEFHGPEGEPPGWVLGAWKERAKLETPARLGLALDALARIRPGSGLGERAGRLRRVVWQRFLSLAGTAGMAERVLLLRWLGDLEWALGSSRMRRDPGEG